jgi:hypothetical protein
MNGLLFDNTLNHMVTKILYQNTCNYKWPFRMLIILLLIVCMLFFLVFVILIDLDSATLFHGTMCLLAQRMCMFNMHAKTCWMTKTALALEARARSTLMTLAMWTEHIGLTAQPLLRNRGRRLAQGARPRCKSQHTTAANPLRPGLDFWGKFQVNMKKKRDNWGQDWTKLDW